jgi:hypothetical protein
MKNLFLLVAVSMLLLLSGCASAPRADKARDSQAKTFSPKANLSGIYIYRDVFYIGAGARFQVNMDEKPLGQVDNGTFMYLEVSPGEHLLESTGGMGNVSVWVKAAAGTNLFFRIDDYSLQKVDAKSGKETVSKLSMVDVSQSAIQAIADHAKEHQPIVEAALIKPEIPVKVTKLTKAPSERLVLMPLRVGEEDKRLQGAMETALVQGLQQNYIVFAGEQVAQKAHEIFLKESRTTTKKECDETRCMQGIAEAFQAELIATANVTKQDGGYFLALSIQNIFDNKVVYSNSVPCEGCTTFQVVNKLKELSAQ